MIYKYTLHIAGFKSIHSFSLINNMDLFFSNELIEESLKKINVKKGSCMCYLN